MLGAFTVFFMKCEFFLEHERHMHSRCGSEQNFGHGQHHLAAILLILNLLAFIFHTFLYLVDKLHQQIRLQRGARKGFFQDILSHH